MRSAIVSIGWSSASWAISRLLFMGALPLVADRGGRQLGHQPVLVEALEREGLDQLRRPPGGDELGERRPDDGRRLEAVGSPPRAHVEALHLRRAEDRAEVGADVAQPGP